MKNNTTKEERIALQSLMRKHPVNTDFYENLFNYAPCEKELIERNFFKSDALNKINRAKQRREHEGRRKK